jgi:hypothetical protein
LLLARKSVGHNALECSDPILVRPDQIDERLGSAHMLGGFARFVSSSMAPLKPGIRKRLHAVQNLFLVFLETLRIFSKRGRNCASWQKHLLDGGPLFSEIRIFHGLPPMI